MPQSTFQGATPDGLVSSNNIVYSSARAGSNLSADAGSTSGDVGQALSGGISFVNQGFLVFPTTTLPDNAQITAATIRLYVVADASAQDFTLEVYARDWGTLDTGDFVAGADLGGLTLVASLATAGLSGIPAYKDLTSEAALLTAISKTASSRFLVASSRQRANNAPLGNEFLTIAWGDDSDSNKRPRLIVDYIAPSGASRRSVLGVG